jgi:hypothetical protein
LGLELVELLDGEFAQVDLPFPYDRGHGYTVFGGLWEWGGRAGGEGERGWDEDSSSRTRQAEECMEEKEKQASVAAGKQELFPVRLCREETDSEGEGCEWQRRTKKQECEGQK